MEAQGPTTQRGNTLPPESRTSFDPARNFQGKAATAFSPDGRATVRGNDVSGPSRTTVIASSVNPVPRTTRLAISARGALLKELVDMIGTDAAARLIAAFGGLRLYVPHEPGPGDTLSQTVGYDAALTLAKGFGGDRIEIPNPTARGIQIVELRASGVSIEDIARSQRCTVRRVYQVLAEARRTQTHREARLPQPPQ